MIESIICTFLADAQPHRQLYNTASLSFSLSLSLSLTHTYISDFVQLEKLFCWNHFS